MFNGFADFLPQIFFYEPKKLVFFRSIGENCSFVSFSKLIHHTKTRISAPLKAMDHEKKNICTSNWNLEVCKMFPFKNYIKCLISRLFWSLNDGVTNICPKKGL